MNQYLEKQIVITEFQFKITIPNQPRSDGILAFGELNMITEVGDTIFRQRGFTIKERQFNRDKEPVVLADFPAFRSGKGWVKSFITEDENILEIIRKGFLDKYYAETDNTGGKEGKKKDDDFDIDDEDIPF